MKVESNVFSMNLSTTSTRGIWKLVLRGWGDGVSSLNFLAIPEFLSHIWYIWRGPKVSINSKKGFALSTMDIIPYLISTKPLALILFKIQYENNSSINYIHQILPFHPWIFVILSLNLFCLKCHRGVTTPPCPPSCMPLYLLNASIFIHFFAID